MQKLKRFWGIRHLRYLKLKGDYQKAFRVLGRFRGGRGLQLTRNEQSFLESVYRGEA